jgi:hypothetical protein
MCPESGFSLDDSQNNEDRNEEDDEDANAPINMLDLLRAAQEALSQQDGDNTSLCNKLERALDETERTQEEEKEEHGKTGSFIKSVQEFDDDLTNFFLFNYSDHHGDHDALHKILSGETGNQDEKDQIVSQKEEKNHRHASVASLHIDDDSSHHKLTSAKILGLLVSWEFNIFELFDLIGPNTFVIVGDGIIQHMHALITELNFDHVRFLSALRQLGETYLDNPYHNQLHGADVAQALNWTLTRGGAASAFGPKAEAAAEDGETNSGGTTFATTKSSNNQVPQITMLAAILAALAHDAGHPGVNNNYLVDVSDPLALTYNDHSPLEHMHAATFFRILQKEECRFIPDDHKDKSRAMRGVIVNMILSTDMMKHGGLIGELKGRLQAGGSKLTEDGRDIQLVLNVCLHLADISNPAREIRNAVQWAQRVQEEFWRQGDLTLEFDPSATIAPMNDREHAARTVTHASSLQIGFTLGLVKPLFELVHSIEGVDLTEPLRMIADNLNTYQTLKNDNLPMTMENIEDVLEYQLKS